MGCFSFICKKCGKPIRSDSTRGESVYLFLLEKGKVVEAMIGEYNSYGGVFDNDGQSTNWYMNWDSVCDLMSSPGSENGIAAIHTDCCTGKSCEFPTTRSEDDPDQGWGKFQTADGQWFGLEWEEDEDDH